MDRNYILIGIRFLGILFGSKALFSITKIAGSIWMVCFTGMSPAVIIFGDIIIHETLTILIAVYFLFFGRFIYKVINNQFDKRFEQSADIQLAYLCFSMWGIWFAVRAFFKLYDLVFGLIARWYIVKENISLSTKFAGIGLTPQNLIEMSNERFLQSGLDIIIFSLLAYYLIFKGGLAIKLLNNLSRLRR